MMREVCLNPITTLSSKNPIAVQSWPSSLPRVCLLTYPQILSIRAIKMVFTRPQSLPMPSVWHRFTAGGTKLRVQDLVEDQFEEAVALLKTHFTADEPPCKYIGIQNHAGALAELEKLWRDTIRDRLSVVCVEDKDGGSEVIGVNVLTVAFKSHKEEPFKTDDPIWAKLFGAVDLVGRSVDIFQKYGVDQYLTAYGLVVAPKWRGMGIGKEMLLASEYEEIIGEFLSVGERRRMAVANDKYQMPQPPASANWIPSRKYLGRPVV